MSKLQETLGSIIQLPISNSVSEEEAREDFGGQVVIAATPGSLSHPISWAVKLYLDYMNSKDYNVLVR